MNEYGSKAKHYTMEYCPQMFRDLENRDEYFESLGNEAARIVDSVYRQIARPELGENDLASWMMAKETVNELLYPPAEEGHEEGWERIETADEDEFQRIWEAQGTGYQNL